MPCSRTVEISKEANDKFVLLAVVVVVVVALSVSCFMGGCVIKLPWSCFSRVSGVWWTKWSARQPRQWLAATRVSQSLWYSRDDTSLRMYGNCCGCDAAIAAICTAAALRVSTLEASVEN